MDLEGTVLNGVIVPDEPIGFSEGTRIVFEPKPAVAKKPMPKPGEPTLLNFLQFAGTIQDMPADFSMEHDHYIHGTPRRKPLAES
jgi:hypothetical protein